MARLYECAIMVDELRDASQNLITPAELITEKPFYLLAKNDTQATIEAGKAIPDELIADKERYDRLVLIVRPF